ncbi:MAG: hypothetical protein SNJ76_10570, partial [Fimbriimonadaceae bacterium]
MRSKLFALWALVVLGALAGPAAAQGVLKGVSFQPSGEGWTVRMAGDGLGAPTVTPSNGGRVISYVFDGNLSGKAGYQRIRKNGVQYVSWGWVSAKPPKVRVRLVMQNPQPVQLAEHKGTWTLFGGSAIAQIRSEDPFEATPEMALALTAQAQPRPTAPRPAPTPVAPRVPQEPFPDRVPPLEPARPVRAATATSLVNEMQRVVTLNFERTDVVQILKALALQAGVDIVISPDVARPGAAPSAAGTEDVPIPTGPVEASGSRLTVALNRVSVQQALDIVCAMANLRYARVGRAYVVTSSERFAQSMRHMANHLDTLNEIRVVPIVSGEGAQIRHAVYEWFGRTTIQVILPQDGVPPADTPTPNSPDGAAPAAPGAASPAPTPAASTDPSAGSTYVFLVGETKWVDAAEKLVRKLDGDIIEARTIQRLESIRREEERANASLARTAERNMLGETIRRTYETQFAKAVDLRAIVANEEQFRGLSILAAPRESTRQVLIVEGRRASVESLIEVLSQLDTGTNVGDKIRIYDVKFADPRTLREEIVAQVPGIRVSVAPASSGNPKLFREGQALRQATETVSPEQARQDRGAAPPAAAGQVGAVSVAKETAEVRGIAQPFQEVESAAVPMRLVLRGTDEQIELALAYLSLVDIAPRQVALELRVMEMSKEDAIRAGLDWSVLTGGTVQAIRINQGVGDTSSSPGTVSGDLGFAGGGTASILATLDSIANKRNLIARPNLLAIDGRETEIFVGDVVRYIESIVQSQNGTTVTTGEVPVGVRLAVLARIGGEGNITMDLRPVVSTLRGFTPVPGGGQLPQTSLRIAQSTVQVVSGETIAIGGLIQDGDRVDVRGIPLLKDLPIVGNLFKRTDNTRDYE